MRENKPGEIIAKDRYEKCYIPKRLISEVMYFEFYKKDTIYTFRSNRHLSLSTAKGLESDLLTVNQNYPDQYLIPEMSF